MSRDTAGPGGDGGRSKRGRDATAIWRAEVDAMCDRMQTTAFTSAALRLLNEPLRVQVPEHMRRR